MEREREISALLYRNVFRHAVITYPDKPEVSGFVKPTETEREQLTKKQKMYG